ncbi:MAG: hypothetical protein WC917_04530 [Bacilli bacterium]|jgi:hypothetical protein
MASKDSLEIRELLAKGTVIQAGTNGSVAIRLRKIGTETATSVTVTTATNIVLVGSVTTDTIAFATYTTYGAVVDAINATGRWEAKIIDALRSKASASTLVDGAVTASADTNGLVIWDVKQDTDASLQIAVCLTPARDFDAPKGHSVELRELKYSVNMGTAAADSVQIWIRKGTVETQVFGELSVDTTATTINFAGGEVGITGGVDEEIVALVKDAAALSDAAGNYVRVTGIVK